MMIKKLPKETISKLQSGVVLRDTVQCVQELVYNSLDAKATAIAVRIDFQNYEIQVIDNGSGISKTDLELVGERYMTSKYNSFNWLDFSTFTYGFRGQAISSLLDVCGLLMIESKFDNEGPTYMKVFNNKKSKPVAEVYSEKTGTGTTVTIKDFMSNMPVRRKRINEIFDTEEIKSQLQFLAIIHFNVSFTLRNENKGMIVFQTHHTTSTLLSIANVFGKNLASSLKTFKYEEEKCNVSGFVSLYENSCNVQLIYVNNRVIKKGTIHKFIKDLMKKYIEKKFTLETNKNEGVILENIKTHCNIVFIVHIKCPSSEYHLHNNLSKSCVKFKNLDAILKCILRGVKRALKFSNSNNNLESSLSTAERCEVSDIIDEENKKYVGTSLLVNAVKGEPVKRKIKTKVKSLTKKKNKKIIENFKDKKEVLSERNNKVDNDCKKTLSETDKSKIKALECTNGSMESPIPKNQLKASLKRNKNVDLHSNESNSIKNINQSFLQFYDWLKIKFVTDINAFNLYKDFLRYKKSKKFHKNSDFKMPKSLILARKNNFKELKKNWKEEKIHAKIQLSGNDSLLNVNSKNEKFKFIPDSSYCKKEFSNQLQYKNIRRQAVNKNYGENKNFFLGCQNSIEFEMLTKKQVGGQTISSKKSKLTEFNEIITSSESKLDFINLMKLRNLSDGYEFQSFCNQDGILPEKNMYSAVSNSWISHYNDRFTQNVPSNKLQGKKYNETFKSLDEDYVVNSFINFQYQDDRYSKPQNFIDIFSEPNTKFKNAETQTSPQNLIIMFQKVDAMVQTFATISDGGIKNISGDENTFVDSQCFVLGSNFTSPHQVECNAMPKNCENLKVLSQEAPYPYFRNFPQQEVFDKASQSIISNTEKSNMGKTSMSSTLIPKSKEQSSESSGIICCAQKSQYTSSQQKQKSSSRETQTFDAIWTDSLMEIKNFNENLNSHNTEPNLSDTSTQLPKTIPIEDLVPGTFNSEQKFCFSERHDFVPKGFSPKFVNPKSPKMFALSPKEKSKIKSTITSHDNEILTSVKWLNESTGSSTKPIIPDEILDEIRLKAENNLTCYDHEILSASLTYCAVKIRNLLHSFVFTKELLSSIEVLGQLDKKFIVAKMNISVPKKMNLISLFDQHAVDERIKLEKIMNEYLTPEGSLISVSVSPTIDCSFSESTVRLLLNLHEKLLNIGVIIKALDEKTITIHAVPMFLIHTLEKNLKNKKKTSLQDAIETLFKDIVVEITETRGMISKLPKSIHNAFCLEACHSAIKFNKILTIENMIEMINQLKECKLPFQCAHGRPSVIPIIDLEDFKPLIEDSDDIDIQKIKTFHNNKKNQENFSN